MITRVLLAQGLPTGMTQGTMTEQAARDDAAFERDDPRQDGQKELPLTGERSFYRIVTERRMLDMTPACLQVVEVLPGWAKEQIVTSTEPTLLW